MKSSGDFPFIDTPHQFYKKILVPPPTYDFSKILTLPVSKRGGGTHTIMLMFFGHVLDNEEILHL